MLNLGYIHYKNELKFNSYNMVTHEWPMSLLIVWTAVILKWLFYQITNFFVEVPIFWISLWFVILQIKQVDCNWWFFLFTPSSHYSQMTMIKFW
jgi:hypothetical protein